eukprot:TRINITY_DN6857_c0_g1_i2.p1 TRINITY_DN6857_c0_g1~~TRINITY_DN6857_c0_g1_i2.p1  ORF type:complete len:745 (+),score=264.75 TRINITY_DN6857_c0_g1_i2:86-2236(+)
MWAHPNSASGRRPSRVCSASAGRPAQARQSRQAQDHDAFSAVPPPAAAKGRAHGHGQQQWQPAGDRQRGRQQQHGASGDTEEGDAPQPHTARVHRETSRERLRQDQGRQPHTARTSTPGSGKSTPHGPTQPAFPNPGVSITPAQALKHYSDGLTDYEQSEIFDYPHIYYLGAGAQKVRGSIANSKNNHGYDDDRGDYNYVTHDHIGFRFEILNILGKGSFGQVLKVFDYKENRPMALKVIRNKKRFHHQALVEVKILDHLRTHDPDDQYNIVKMEEYFYFRNHLCITFELLSINLYEFIKNNNFQGVSLGLIRRFAIQLLTSLKYLYRERIIHCDLKPENILLKSPTKSGIKMIDFGSSCFDDERIYTYIQSRFYRSPEVILGISYGRAIDSWSFGCILAELYTGLPLFPGENEMEQLACIMEILDVPPRHIIEQSTRRKQFFDSHDQPRIEPNSRGKRRRPGAKDLQSALHCSDPLFISFLEGFLRWDHRQRFTPEDGLRHEWILEGMMVPSSLGRQPAPTYRAASASASGDARRRRHREQPPAAHRTASKERQPGDGEGSAASGRSQHQHYHQGAQPAQQQPLQQQGPFAQWPSEDARPPLPHQQQQQPQPHATPPQQPPPQPQPQQQQQQQQAQPQPQQQQPAGPSSAQKPHPPPPLPHALTQALRPKDSLLPPIEGAAVPAGGALPAKPKVGPPLAFGQRPLHDDLAKYSSG